MKHSYRADCDCRRCTREHSRRNQQAAAEHSRQVATGEWRRPTTRRARRSSARRPTPGTQEWAETRGDDIPSLDQPGDDFDMP